MSNKSCNTEPMLVPFLYKIYVDKVNWLMILVYATFFNGQVSFKGQLCKLGAVETDCDDKTLHVLSQI